MTTAVFQARMRSTRLPGKVLRRLGTGTTLSWVVRAAEQSGGVDDVVIAASTEPVDAAIAEAGSTLGRRVAFGPEDDVLDRFRIALDGCADAETVIRLTADCPLLDPSVIAMAVRAFNGSGLDYLSTTNPRSLPRGLDVEVTSAGALRRIDALARDHERTHVNPHLYLHPGLRKAAGIVFFPDASDLRVTPDTPEGAVLLDALVGIVGDVPPDRSTLVKVLRDNLELVRLNEAVRQKALEEG